MAEVQEILIRFQGDTTGINASINAVKNQVAGLGANINQVSQTMVQSTKEVTGHLNAQYNQMSRMVHMFQSALFYMAGHAVFRALSAMFDTIINKGIQFNTTMEETNIALKVMLGSAKEAETLLSKVWDIAAHTPFEFAPLAEATKQLIAFGYTAAELPNLLMHISDAVSALGGGMEKTQRIVTNLGQIMALGIINAREIRDLSTQGINMYKALAEYLGKSTAEIAKMVTEKMIDAKTAVAAFMDYAENKFGGFSEIMSMKFTGLGATIRDFFVRATGELTSGLYQIEQEAMRGILPTLSKITNYLILNKEAITKWTREVFNFWIRVYESVVIVAKGLGGILIPVLSATWKIILDLINAVTKFIIENEKFIINIVKITVAMKAYLLIVHALPAALIAIKAATTTLAYAYAYYVIATTTATGASVGFFGALNALRVAVLASLPLWAQLGIIVAGIAAGLAAFAPPTPAVSMEKDVWLRQKKEEIQEFTAQLEDLGFSFAEINQAIEEVYQKEQSYWNVTRDSVMQQILNIRMKTAEEKMAALEKTALIEEEVANIIEANEKLNNLNKAQIAELAKKSEAFRKHIEELIKLQQMLKDKIYTLSHNEQQNELYKLEQWLNEQKVLVQGHNDLLILLYTAYNMEKKSILDKYAQEELDRVKKLAEEEEKIQQELFENNIARIEARAQKERELAENAAKSNKELQREIDRATKGWEENFWADISDWIASLPPGTDPKLIEKVVSIRFKEAQAAQAENFASILQLDKDMTEFLKEFDMERFKANAQKVIDISIEAAKFISTLKFDLPPDVAEKIKEINKVFNEVTIGNLVTMIKSFIDFSKIIEEAEKTKPITPEQIEMVLTDMTGFLIMLVQETNEWIKCLQKGNNILPAIKALNEVFKDVAITDFVRILKEVFGLMEFINRLESYKIEPERIEWMLIDFTNFLIMFVQETQGWIKCIQQDSNLLATLKVLNETFKDTSINEFTTTLKNMFDFMDYINKLEYKPVTGEQLDKILTDMTEFMVLLANRTDDWIKALQNDNLLEKMKALNATFKDTALNEFMNTVKSIFDLVKLFLEAPKYSPETIANSIGNFFLDLEKFVQTLDNVIINIGRERLGEIASGARETFTLLNELFKGITLDEFMKMIKSLDDVLGRFTEKYDTEGKKIPDLMDDVMNVASRIKWFFTQLDTLAKELKKMFEGEEGKYLEAVVGRVKESFDRLNNAFKGISLKDFTEFLTMLKAFEEGVMMDKNGHLMTSFDIEKVKVAILTMLTQLESLSKELDDKLKNKTGAIGADGERESWIDTLKTRLENTIGRIAEIMKYVSDTMLKIKSSWYEITGTTTDIKDVFLSVIMECVTGLNEVLDSPAWKGITDKLENTYLKIVTSLGNIQLEFGNLKTNVINHIETLNLELSISFASLQTVVDNADKSISQELKEFADNIKSSEAVKALTDLLTAVSGLITILDNFVSKINTWIVAFTKFCFTITFLAEMAARAVDLLNLAIDELLKKAGAFKAFVEESKSLMMDLIKTFSTWGEMIGNWQQLVDQLTTPGASEAGFWKGTDFGQNPWDFPPQWDPSTGVGAGGWYDTGGTYHPPTEPKPPGGNNFEPPIVINGNLVLQGVQNPQQLIDELKRVGNMRGAVNVNYNY